MSECRGRAAKAETACKDWGRKGSFLRAAPAEMATRARVKLMHAQPKLDKNGFGPTRKSEIASQAPPTMTK